MRRLRPGPLGLIFCLACGRGLPAFLLVLVLWSGAVASDLHPVIHGEGRLWRIEHAGMPPSHIMGTIHVADPRVRDLPAPILEAFKTSDQAAFELLLTPEERRAIAQSRRTPDDDDASHREVALSKLLDKKTYDRTVAVAARYGIPAKAVDQIPPGALAFLFQTPPDELRRRAEGDLFLDIWLIQWAYDLGMKVVALEKLEEQLALFDDASQEDQVDALRETLDQLEEDPDPLETMIVNYLDGNMTPAYRRMEEMARDSKQKGAREFKAAFLDNRNRQMVERMIPLLERGRLFVAVGALHMPGDQGILHLLEQRGYRITRVY